MELKDLYKGNYKGCIVTLILSLTCLIVSIPTYFNTDLFNVLAVSSKPGYIWQYFSGAFEHGIIPPWFLWLHMGTNFTMLFLFGLMIEKVIGSNKMAILSFVSLFTFTIVFQIALSGQDELGSGASGIFYSYGPIALYMIIKAIKLGHIQFWRKPLFYVYIIEYLLMWPLLLLIAPFETNLFHGISALGGVVFLLLWKKDIDLNLNELISLNSKKKDNSSFLNILWILPVFMGSIVIYSIINLV